MKQGNLKKWIFYISAAGMILAMKLVRKPLSAGAYELSVLQIKAAAILLFALVNWIAETVPVAITALIVIVIVPFAEIMSFSEAIQGSFGNSIFGFFLGTLILSEAFSQTNVGKLIAGGLSRIFGRTPKATIFAIMFSGMFLAMWVTEVAASAIVFPIALSIVTQVEEKDDRAWFGKAMMLAVAWGCAFGGVATPIATGANLIALSYLEEYCSIKIGFLQWMKIGVPISLTLLLVGWGILGTIVKSNREFQWKEEHVDFGTAEKKLIVIFIIAVILWVFGGKIGIGSHHVALLMAIVLFFPGIEVLQWKKTMGSISWDSIMLICSGVLIGDLLYDCGLAEIISDLFFIPSLLHQGVFWSGVYIVMAVSVLKIMFSSNTVTGIVLVPIMILLADKTQLPAWQMVAPCVFSSALSLVVITSSPVNVIPYSAKYFTPMDMIKYGVPMTVASAGIIAFWLMILG